jgi:hypothetical protein
MEEEVRSCSGQRRLHDMVSTCPLRKACASYDYYMSSAAEQIPAIWRWAKDGAQDSCLNYVSNDRT